MGSVLSGVHGNSLRVVVTDAGADQIGYLAQPTSAEWEFTAGAEVSFSAANIYAKVYGYSVVVTLKDDATLIGELGRR